MRVRNPLVAVGTGHAHSVMSCTYSGNIAGLSWRMKSLHRAGWGRGRITIAKYVQRLHFHEGLFSGGNDLARALHQLQKSSSPTPASPKGGKKKNTAKVSAVSRGYCCEHLGGTPETWKL